MLVVEVHREVPISGMHDIYRLIIIIFDCVHHSIKTQEWKDIKNSALLQTYFHCTWKQEIFKALLSQQNNWKKKIKDLPLKTLWNILWEPIVYKILLFTWLRNAISLYSESHPLIWTTTLLLWNHGSDNEITSW